MELTRHLRVSEPFAGILAFYDGRMPGFRFAEGDNWVDDGALSLGIASYAVISGEEALVYDTHISVPHATAVRAALEARGVRTIRVVLSHWHLDHVAGTVAFRDCEIIATHRCLDHLTQHQAGIEDGSFHGLPAICPLILPDHPFTGEMRLRVGTRHVTLIEANIHSDDAAVLWLPEERIMLAGDTVEDCVTYVGEPQDFAVHLADLDRLAALAPLHVLPNHGAGEVIAGGGYGPELLAATARYIRWLLRLEHAPELAGITMRDVIADDLVAGTLRYFQPYEAVHAQNMARCMALWHKLES
jgi:cyclase